MTWDGDAIFVPEETELTAPYWEAGRRGAIALQRCAACDVVWHPPQPRCPECRSAVGVTWTEASGRGTVWSYTVVRHAAHASMRDQLPYVVALVELEEGPRIVTNLVGAEIGDVAMGMPVELRLGRSAARVTLPVAVPTEPS